LEGPSGQVHDQTEMMRLVINLFAAEKTEGLALSQSFWDINDLVTENENEALTAPFFSGNKGIKLVFSVVILLEIGSGRHACGGTTVVMLWPVRDWEWETCVWGL